MDIRGAPDEEVPRLRVPDVRLKEIIGILKDKEGLVPMNELSWLIDRAMDMFKWESSMIRVLPPITICGDLHGQFDDLLDLFRLNGWPPKSRYLFLGDYVDRGEESIATITLLLALKTRYPGSIYLLRGNHEISEVNRCYGFYDEVMKKYNKETYDKFNGLFNWLPFAALVAEKILCIHAGISPFLTGFQDIDALQRPFDFTRSAGIVADLLLGTPDSNVIGFRPNHHEFAHAFGEDAVQAICEKLNLLLVVRSHEVVANGYEYFANGKMVTLFTARDYCGQFKNRGSVLTVDQELACSIQQLPLPVEKPNSAATGESA